MLEHKIFRPSILRLTPYSSARSLTANAASEPLQYMDANEFPETPLLSGVNCESPLNRYPSPQPLSLLKAFSNVYEVPIKNILITRGSDEAIDVLTRAVCEPITESSSSQDAILITPPTYGMYEVSADIQNTPVVKIPLILKEDQWTLDLQNIQKKLMATTPKIKIVYICSPNNPTGATFTLKQITTLLNFLPEHTLLVLDEAYFEFSQQNNSIAFLSQYPQLVILRTLSKAWGLAGLRCGTLIAHENLIAILQKVRAPYPIPTPVSEIATAALSPQKQIEMKQRVAVVLDEREKLKTNLLKLSNTVRVYPSETNFLLVEFSDANHVMRISAKQGIVLRDRSSQILNCVRITVGTPSENQKLLKSLQEMSPL